VRYQNEGARNATKVLKPNLSCTLQGRSEGPGSATSFGGLTIWVIGCTAIDIRQITVPGFLQIPNHGLVFWPSKV